MSFVSLAASIGLLIQDALVETGRRRRCSAMCFRTNQVGFVFHYPRIIALIDFYLFDYITLTSDKVISVFEIFAVD